MHKTLVAPEPDFVVRPQLIAEPLGVGVAQRLPLSRFVADAGCELVAGSVTSVDPASRVVVLRAGGTLPHDTLLLAPRSGPRHLRWSPGCARAAGINFIRSQHADVVGGSVRLRGDTRGKVSADRIVAPPPVRGPRIPGVPPRGCSG